MISFIPHHYAAKPCGCDCHKNAKDSISVVIFIATFLLIISQVFGLASGMVEGSSPVPVDPKYNACYSPRTRWSYAIPTFALGCKIGGYMSREVK